MAKKCAECGEKLKLTSKPWQYITTNKPWQYITTNKSWQYITTLPVFCSDEHRAAYEGRAALEAQSKPQPAIQSQQSAPKGPIGRWFQASAIGRWYHGRLKLEYTFWITFVSIPLLMGAVTYFIFAELNLAYTMDRMPLAFLTGFVVSGILSYGLLAAVAVVRCARRYEHPTFWSRTASILAWVYAVGPGLIGALVFALSLPLILDSLG